MTTIPDSVKAQLDADWTAAGGTEPTYYVEEDFRTNPPLGKDAVWIMSKSLDTGARPVNDSYVDEEHILRLVVTTTTSADRLKELADEVVRILNATAIANITYQRMRQRRREDNEYNGLWVYQEIVTYDLREQMKDSAAAYGSGTTGDFAVVGNLTVGGTAEVTGVTTLADESLTSTQISDFLMFGSANAIFVPCVFYGSDQVGKHVGSRYQKISNVDATDIHMMYNLPLPLTKGSLKLYVDNIVVGVADADANNYVDTIYLYGWTDHDSISDIENVDVTLNSAQSYTWSRSATDCSGYKQVGVTLDIFATDANALDISWVLAYCYYST